MEFYTCNMDDSCSPDWNIGWIEKYCWSMDTILLVEVGMIYQRERLQCILLDMCTCILRISYPAFHPRDSSWWEEERRERQEERREGGTVMFSIKVL
jgi:hypothetical protein